MVVGNGVAYGGFINGPLQPGSFYQIFVRQVHVRETDRNVSFSFSDNYLVQILLSLIINIHIFKVEHFKVTDYIQSEANPGHPEIFSTLQDKSPEEHTIDFLVDVWDSDIRYVLFGVVGILAAVLLFLFIYNTLW